MPFSPGGVFSLVASYFANPGTTIRTEQHNPVFEDVASALSQVLIRDGRAPMTGPLNMNGFAINNVVAGNTATSVATLAQAMPIGAVIDYAGTSPPPGWLMCYGQAVSRTTYAALFAVLGTAFGAGDGSTTFNLPDLRGRVSAGWDGMGFSYAGRLTGNFAAGQGAQSHTLFVQELPAANYEISGFSDPITVTSTRNDIVTTTNQGLPTTGLNNGIFSITHLPAGSVPTSVTSTGSFTPRGVVGPIGSGQAHNNVQPTLILYKIIRVSYDV